MSRHRRLFRAIEIAVLDGEGESPAALRRAVARGETPPGDALAAYLGKVHEHAYKVTDADVAALKAAGLSEETIFELTVNVAAGEGQRRFDAGMDALGGES